MMELRQLEYFLAVSREKSFTRAAEQLYISQPAVTNAIRNLENELGIQLFDRSQKQALLTLEGQVFYHHVENVMSGVSKTLAEINDLKNLNSGVLTLGLTPLAALSPLAQLLAGFHQKYTGIKAVFYETDSESLQRKLVEEKIDAAVLFQNDASLPSLQSVPLPADELVACCSRSHRFRHKNSLLLKELVEEQLILLKKTCFLRQLMLQHFETSDTLPKIVFESSQLQTIRALVAASGGISILPRTLCEEDHRLIAISFAPAIYVQPFFCWKQTRVQSHAAGAFIDFLKKFLSEGGAAV